MVLIKSRLSLTILTILLAITAASFALATPISAGGATTVTSSQSIPIGLFTFVPCANNGAGEFVILNGDLHLLFHMTLNKGKLHVTSQANPQGINGTGLSTGDSYRGTGVTRMSINVDGGGFPLQFTFVNNFRIIGQGPKNNFLVHQVTHLTVNANGQITANVSNSSIDCK